MLIPLKNTIFYIIFLYSIYVSTAGRMPTGSNMDVPLREEERGGGTYIHRRTGEEGVKRETERERERFIKDLNMDTT